MYFLDDKSLFNYLLLQLVKNVFLTNERKISRKFVEGILSLILERRLSKWEVLYSYLNKVYKFHITNWFMSLSNFFFLCYNFEKVLMLLDLKLLAEWHGLCLPNNEFMTSHWHQRLIKWIQNNILRVMLDSSSLLVITTLKMGLNQNKWPRCNIIQPFLLFWIYCTEKWNH